MEKKNKYIWHKYMLPPKDYVGLIATYWMYPHLKI